MYNLKGRDPHEFFTVSFRCYVKHAQMVSDAAEQAGTNPADYARKVVLDWAASDLGLPAPDYSPLPNFSKALEAAAKRAGVSADEYVRRAAAEKLERDLAAGSTEQVYVRATQATERANQAIRRADAAVRKISGTRKAS